MTEPTTDKPELPGLPTVPERRCLCNHTTMERVFSTANIPVSCQMCDEAALGWIYVCTEEDTRGDGRIMMSMTEEEAIARDHQKRELDPKLNGWVAQAIEQGHYTEDQIQVLRSQRSNVHATIAKENQLQGPNEDDPHDVSLIPDDQVLEALIKSLTAPTTTCHLRLCHYCFPAGKDRAWLSLNEVCADREAVAIDNWPENLSRIPSSDLPRMRPHSCKVCEPGAARTDNKTVLESILESNNEEAVVDDNDDNNGDIAMNKPQPDLWPNDPTSETPSDRSARELLEAAFANYKRQQLGTPQKNAHRRRNAFSTPASADNNNESNNENTPSIPVRPKLARRARLDMELRVKRDEEKDPQESCFANEVSGLGEADVAMQV